MKRKRNSDEIIKTSLSGPSINEISSETAIDKDIKYYQEENTKLKELNNNQIIEIEERETLDPPSPTPAPQPLFESLVTDPDPVPPEPDASEINRQPLRPTRPGTAAPGVAWSCL